MLSGDKHQEGVVFDNEFHRSLSDVRNNNIDQNHPDLELFFKENAKKVRRDRVTDMLNSLTGMEAMDGEQSTQPTTAKHTSAGRLMKFAEIVEKADSLLKHAQSTDHELAVLVILLPELKAVNSMMGETALTTIKNQIFEKINTAISSNGRGMVAGNMEDDKILLLLPSVPEPIVKLYIKRIQEGLAESELSYLHFKVRACARVGFSLASRHGETWEELVARADLAAEKRRGS